MEIREFARDDYGSLANIPYIGLSEFGRYRESDDLQAGLVGVKRACRRRGIALAMHWSAIAYARVNRHPVIRSGTTVTNRPMLGLYTRLGFVAPPDWIHMEKRLEAR